MVATPIGNLADITLRALHVLQLVDVLACEDTRHTQSLLRAYGIDHSPSSLIALHQHNESEAAAALIDRLNLGQRVAYVSDAGTPAISDPGARLVAAVHQAGLPVIPLPGASSITTLLSVAGARTDTEPAGFVFAGFLPSKASDRQAALKALAKEARPVVLLEAPHRIEDLARALAILGERPVTIGRELTKQYEEVCLLRADAVSRWLSEKPQRSRGEFVLLVHPQPSTHHRSEDQVQPSSHQLLKLLLAELPHKTAVRLVAEFTNEPRNALYETALKLKQDQKV